MADYKRRMTDRYDGRRIRTLGAFYGIIPFIMRSRMDSQIYFEDKIDITHTEAYLRRKRKEGVNDINFLHVMIAAMVRTFSQKPGLNRFIAGQRIYARNEILGSLAIKKELKSDSPETTIKLKFEPDDTIDVIARRMNEAIEENKKPENSNDTDKTARLFMLCPAFLVRFLIWLVRLSDFIGLMPKALNKASPFHTSFFITDLGSLGVQPVYHHLYDFGTTSLFLAFGAKVKEKAFDANISVIEKKYVNIKVTTDERIVDGYYYASAFKLYKSLVQHPERLELPPDQVEEDIE